MKKDGSWGISTSFLDENEADMESTLKAISLHK